MTMKILDNIRSHIVSTVLIKHPTKCADILCSEYPKVKLAILLFSLSDEAHKAEHSDALAFHAHTTLAPTLVVAFALFAIFGAYFFFRHAGAKSKKSR